MFQILKKVVQHFLNSNTFQKGAALAYYAVFSLLPIIIIVSSVLGIFFGEQAVAGEIYTQLKDILGDDAALQIQNIIKNQHTSHNNILTSLIGFIALALTASGMFGQIHSAFNSIWNLKSKPRSSVLGFIKKKAISFFVLITLFLTLIISTSINSLLVRFSRQLFNNHQLVKFLEHGVSFLLIGFVFALMFKFLGDAVMNWRVAFAGGLFTSILFIFGKIGIGMYLGQSNLSSTFGSASVLALLMLWVYYTSQIIFLGASFVKVYSDQIGSEILPNADAVRVVHQEV